MSKGFFTKDMMAKETRPDTWWHRGLQLTEEQLREAMANTQLIPAQFMDDFNAALGSVVERLSGREKGSLTTYFDPARGAPAKAAMQAAEKEKAKMKTAQDALIKQSQEVLNDQRDRLTVIVDKFLVELDNSLMNVNKGIAGMSVMQKGAATPIVSASSIAIQNKNSALDTQGRVKAVADNQERTRWPWQNSARDDPAVQDFLSLDAPTTSKDMDTFFKKLGEIGKSDLSIAFTKEFVKIPAPRFRQPDPQPPAPDANRANPTAPLNSPRRPGVFDVTPEENTPPLKAPAPVKPVPVAPAVDKSASAAASAASDKSIAMLKLLDTYVGKIAAISNSSVEQSMTLAKLVNTTVESFSQQAAALPGKFNESFLALGPVLENFNKGADNLSNAVASIPSDIAITSNNTTSINFTGPLKLETDDLEKAIAKQTVASNTGTNRNPATLGDVLVFGRTRSVATPIA